jgi:cardiolipin synthase
VIGTSNLDYRSLYHHFENNVLLCGSEAVQSIAEDFETLFSQCREVTSLHCSQRSLAMRVWQYILRLFAPLM